MSSPHRPYVPRINPTCDVRKLAISPHEAYVLSRIDGFSSATEIGLITGMGEDVTPVLQRLFSLGALIEGPNGASPPAPEPPPLRSVPPPAPAVLQRRPSYTLAELDEEVDIDVDRRKIILQLFHALDQLSHYEVLGVDPGADTKAIKEAYNDLVKLVHPDRYFRKNIGSYKPKLEAIFKRITEARETLARNQTRKEYDAELARKRPHKRPSSAHLDSVHLPVSKPPSIPPPPASSSPSYSTTPVPPAVAAPRHDPPPSPSIAPPPSRAASSIPPREQPASPVRPSSSSDSDERKRILAARLSGRWATRPASAGARPSSAPPPESSPATAAQARDSLRRMALTHQIEQHRGQIERYLGSAQECIAKEDPVGAANAFRLALSCDPENEMIKGLVEEWSGKAAVAQADQNLKLGNAEAALGRWGEAARAYTKAAAGRPEDPEVLQKAANALVQADGDLHLAADLARKAVRLAGHVARYRITLAEVYVAANLGLNARRELAEASKIEPENPRIKALLKVLG